LGAKSKPAARAGSDRFELGWRFESKSPDCPGRERVQANSCYHRSVSGAPVALHPPIFVWGDRNLDAFSSIEDACRYVEPADVDSVVGFDCEGRKFNFAPAVEETPVMAFGRKLWSHKRFTVGVGDAPISDPGGLKEVLLKAFTSVGHPVDSAASLEELVRRAQRIFTVR
jgi:hypothetical protein